MSLGVVNWRGPSSKVVPRRVLPWGGIDRARVPQRRKRHKKAPKSGASQDRINRLPFLEGLEDNRTAGGQVKNDYDSRLIGEHRFYGGPFVIVNLFLYPSRRAFGPFSIISLARSPRSSPTLRHLTWSSL